MFDYRDALKTIEWKEGKLVEKFVVGSYRNAVTIVCTSSGRQQAQFANGQHNYYAYVDLLGGGGQWIQQGNNIVPVLPDGRFIMVVEQRPVLGRYPDHPRIVQLSSGRSFDLGEYGSLEFPGGAIEPGESVIAAFLRELHEETEVEQQSATLYRRCQPIYTLGSDVALRMYYSMVELDGFSFSDYVEVDGGLRVLALTEEEVIDNIRSGVISSGQAALTGWAFYQEIKDPDKRQKLLENGYLAKENVRIVIPS